MDFGGLVKDPGEAVEHSAGAAEDWGAQSGVTLVEPCGQADAAGDGIEFGDGETVIGQEEVGADDAGPIVFESRVALEIDQGLGFALVEPTGDPRGLFSFEAVSVEEVHRAVELEQHPAQLLELTDEFRAEREGVWCDAPGVVEEEPAGGQLIEDRLGLGTGRGG